MNTNVLNPEPSQQLPDEQVLAHNPVADDRFYIEKEYALSEEELPEQVQSAFQNLLAEEVCGLRYLPILLHEQYGIAVCADYDLFLSKESGLTMREMFKAAEMDISKLRAMDPFKNLPIYLSQAQDAEEAHSLVIVYPLTMSREEFRRVTTVMRETVYSSVDDLSKIHGLCGYVEEQINKLFADGKLSELAKNAALKHTDTITASYVSLCDSWQSQHKTLIPLTTDLSFLELAVTEHLSVDPEFLEDPSDWKSYLRAVDLDCALQYEEFLGRPLTGKEEYKEIDAQVDEMVLDFESKEEFFTAYPSLRKYAKPAEAKKPFDSILYGAELRTHGSGASGQTQDVQR